MIGIAYDHARRRSHVQPDRIVRRAGDKERSFTCGARIPTRSAFRATCWGWDPPRPPIRSIRAPPIPPRSAFRATDSSTVPFLFHRGLFHGAKSGAWRISRRLRKHRGLVNWGNARRRLPRGPGKPPRPPIRSTSGLGMARKRHRGRFRGAKRGSWRISASACGTKRGPWRIRLRARGAKRGPWRVRSRARGAKRSVDMMLAGIAAANGAVLVRRNVKDFAFLDVEVVNPFE